MWQIDLAATYYLPPACTLSFRFAANQPIQLFVGKVSVSNCICCQLATHLTCRKTAGQAWILLHFVRILYISPCILSVSALSLCLLQDRPVAASTITQLIKVVNNPDKLAALQVRGRGKGMLTHLPAQRKGWVALQVWGGKGEDMRTHLPAQGKGRVALQPRLFGGAQMKTPSYNYLRGVSIKIKR